MRQADRGMRLPERQSWEHQVTDLFDWKNPQHRPDLPYGGPGYKERTTSREAARKVAPHAMTLREQVLTLLRVEWPRGMTADEVAEKVGKSELSIRPRLSELRTMRAIEPHTTKGVVDRRDNKSGMSAIVWVARRSFGDWS
jgi:hypothetical protein